MHVSDRVTTASTDAGPQRTCIATRAVRPASALLRCVAVKDVAGGGEVTTRVVPDPGRRLPGRGAWITADVKAYETAVQRRAFVRALKVSADVDTTPVLEFLNTRPRGGRGNVPGPSTGRQSPHLTTSPVAEKEKETDY